VIWSEAGGAGGAGAGPTVVLVHGLGATAEVWRPVAESLGDTAPWVLVDLPGHGRSEPAPPYSYDAFAAAVAAVLDPGSEVVIAGHSLGGVVGLALTDGSFGVRVPRTVALGVKVAWTDEELDRAAAMAARPPRTFPSREEAAAWSLRLAGLDGLVDPGDPAVAPGVIETGDGWQAAWDPRSAAVGRPPMATLIAAAQGEVVLACGERDHMVSGAQLADLAPRPVVLAGLGHNAHVEDPARVADLVLGQR
jgi:pimeloyl-ACP methyl ester carboxylesterase